jgi:hypothetical protein
VGGNALTQVLQGERRYDLVMRYLPEYRNTKEAIEDIRLLAPSGERVSLAQISNINVSDGASEIYREENQRYIAIKYSVRGRDLGSAVQEAIQKVDRQVKLPSGYRIDWAGEYESQQRAQRRLAIIVPLAASDLPDPLSDVRVDEMGGVDRREYGRCADRRSSGVVFDAHQLQRVLRCWIFGAVRSVGADRRDHGGVHQPVASARAHDCRRCA